MDESTQCRRVAIIAAALFTACVLTLVGCKGHPTGVDENKQDENGTLRTAVPADLVGTWYHGSISSINFYNPNTGSWANGYGEGLFYSFTAGKRNAHLGIWQRRIQQHRAVAALSRDRAVGFLSAVSKRRRSVGPIFQILTTIPRTLAQKQKL